MAEFPRLRTGAYAQFPAASEVRFSTHVMRFADGAEQRFRQLGAGKRSWQIALNRLTTEETARLRQFFLDRQGGAGTFTFTDPWDESVHEGCRFESDAFTAFFDEENRGRTAIRITKDI